jgi:hypothetical protein
LSTSPYVFLRQSPKSDKALRACKRRQLEADDYHPESTYAFYTDLTDRWISCVMDPASREDTECLIDIDAGTPRPRATRGRGLKSAFEIPILLSTLTEGVAMATQRKFRTGTELK